MEAPTSTHPRETELVHARVQQQRHAYALAKAVQVCKDDKMEPEKVVPLLLQRSAWVMPKEPSQSWTGDGFKTKRNPKGTHLVDILSENNTGTPVICKVGSVSVSAANPAADSLTLVSTTDPAESPGRPLFCVRPVEQDRRNQPIGTLKKGDIVVCFSKTDSEDDSEDDSADMSPYAIKLNTIDYDEVTSPFISEDHIEQHMFLNAYNEACMNYDIVLNGTNDEIAGRKRKG